MDTTSSSSSEKFDVMEFLKSEEFEALKKASSPIRSVHMTHDFFLRLKASESVQNFVVNRVGDLFGYPLIIHDEPSENEYWFEDAEGKVITPQADNDWKFIYPINLRKRLIDIHFPTS